MGHSALVAALIGAGVALVAIYLREALHTAQERLIVAGRLDADIRYWLSQFHRHPDLATVLVSGEMIAQQEAALAGDPKKLIAAREELDRKLAEAVQELGNDASKHQKLVASIKSL